MLKCNSLAMAETLGVHGLRKTAFFLLPNELPEMEAKDDSLFEEKASFLSITQPLAAAKDPTEDIAVKVDAIYYLMAWRQPFKNSAIRRGYQL